MEEVFNWQAVAATFTAQGVEFGGSRPKETGPERRTPEIFRRHSLRRGFGITHQIPINYSPITHLQHVHWHFHWH